MTPISRADFERWARQRTLPAVSIYIPTHEKGPEIDQDPIRFKNAIADAEEQMRQSQIKPAAHRDMLETLRRLVDSGEFWRRQRLGLAVFASPDGLDTVQLPYPVEPVTVVSDCFHVRPLLPALESHEMAVLALSATEVRLFRATEAGLEALQYDGPRSADDVNWFVDRENQLRLHPIGRGQDGFHSAGIERFVDADRERFLVAVADAVAKASRDIAGPTLVLAVNELQAEYRRLADHPIADCDLHGNYDGVDVGELWNVCREAVLTEAARRRAERDDRLAAAVEQGAALLGAERSLEAVITGRAAEVAVHPAAGAVWGRYDARTLTIDAHQQHRPLDVDLVDACVRESLDTGATAVASEAVPVDHGVLALTRF